MVFPVSVSAESVERITPETPLTVPSPVAPVSAPAQPVSYVQKTFNPKDKLVRRVVSTLELSTLRDVCNASIDQLMDLLPNRVASPTDKTLRGHAFRVSAKQPVLAVAHCDVVSRLGKHFGTVNITEDTRVFSPALDDRLGVYTILYTLPALGVSVDVLLTDGEETSRTTAADFTSARKYNWIFSFDRRGEDAVIYQYYGMRKYAEKYFDCSYGSFSDIARMTSLGCLGVNVGTGYHEEHTNRCFMSVREWATNVARFLYFYNEFAKTPMPYKEPEFSVLPASSGYQGYGAYDGYDDYPRWAGDTPGFFSASNKASKPVRQSWRYGPNGCRELVSRHSEEVFSPGRSNPGFFFKHRDKRDHSHTVGERKLYCAYCDQEFTPSKRLADKVCPECGNLLTLVHFCK